MVPAWLPKICSHTAPQKIKTLQRFLPAGGLPRTRVSLIVFYLGASVRSRSPFCWALEFHSINVSELGVQQTFKNVSKVGIQQTLKKVSKVGVQRAHTDADTARHGGGRARTALGHFQKMCHLRELRDFRPKLLRRRGPTSEK